MQPLEKVRLSLETVCDRKACLEQAAEAAMLCASAEQDHLEIPLQVEVQASVEMESVHHGEMDPGQPVPESLAEESGVHAFLAREWPDHSLP